MKIALYLIVLVVAFIGYMRYIEYKTLFYPVKLVNATPQDVGLTYEDIFFKTEDGLSLNGWFVPGAPGRETLLFIHGNAGNISDRLEKITLFHSLGYNLFIFDYRGYGNSEGIPSEMGFYKDARAAYDYLRSREGMAQARIVGYGVSLGGAVAVQLAGERTLHALMIDSSFTCAKDMAKKIFPFVPSGLVYSQWNSVEKIKSISIPKIFLHSRDDEIVPYEIGRRLFDAARQPKQFVDLLGSHNTMHQESQHIFVEAIDGFLRSLK